jgi:hypothetical protein
MPAPRLKLLNKDFKKSVTFIDPSYVQRTLDGVAGKGKNATLLKTRTLFVEVFKDKQAESLLKANLLVSHPIYVLRHTSLSFSRRVISTDGPDGIFDEGIQTCLAGQSVPKVYTLIEKWFRNPFPLQAVFLSFEFRHFPVSSSSCMKWSQSTLTFLT